MIFEKIFKFLACCNDGCGSNNGCGCNGTVRTVYVTSFTGITGAKGATGATGPAGATELTIYGKQNDIFY